MQKQKLLLVEDSDDDAFLFSRTFGKSGMTFGIHHVPNGAQAIDFLRGAATSNSLPPIIFLDLKMPMMNGFEVLAWIQEQSVLSEVRVVVVSGSAQHEDREKASQLGAAEYLVKPVTAADFHRLLDPISPNSKDHSSSEVKAKA